MNRIFILLIAILINLDAFGQNRINTKLDSLQSVLSNAPSDTAKIAILIGISRDISCSDPGKSVYYSEQALILSEKIKWQRGIMLASESIGQINDICLNDHSSAIKYYLRSIAIAQSVSDSLVQANIYNNIGNIYRIANKYVAALEHYKKSADFNTNPRDKVSPIANSGVIYTNLGDYAHALECYEKALKITELLVSSSDRTKRDSLTWFGLQLTIGDVYIAMAQFENALEKYNAALKMTQILKKPDMEMWTLIAIGKAYKLKKDYTTAIQYFESSLAASNSLNENYQKANILNELGNVYTETGDIVKALNYAEQSRRICEEKKNKEQLPRTYTTLGIIFTKKKNYNKALPYFLNAIDICQQTAAIEDEKNAWEAISKTYEYMGQSAKAFDAFRHFITLKDSIYSVDKQKEMVRIDLQSGFSKKQLADSLKQDDAKKFFALSMQRQKALTYGGFAGLFLVVLLSFFIYRNYSQQKKANAIISSANATIQHEKQVSENLLLNILPENVAQELKTDGKVKAKLYNDVTVLFTDFVNFTESGERMGPQALVAELDTCFQAFDEIISKYNIEKIKTVGDAYLAVSGLPQANPIHAADMVKAAIEIRDYMRKRKETHGAEQRTRQDQYIRNHLRTRKGTI